MPLGRVVPRAPSPSLYTFTFSRSGTSRRPIPVSWLSLMTGNTNSTETVFCPPFREIYVGALDTSIPYWVNGLLNAALAVSTTFANLLVLLAMRHVTSVRLPSKLLLCSLVLTDLGAGFVVQPLFAAFLFMKILGPSPVLCSLMLGLNFTTSVFSGASFFTLTAISLDRYAALFIHAKYHQVVTTRRVLTGLTFVWSFSVFLASTSFWKVSLWWIIVIVSISIGVPVISVTSIQIYRRLRNLQVQPLAPHQTQQQARNMERYRRTASAMMWVYIVVLLCYSPFFVMALVTAIRHTALTVCIRDFACTVALLNSCLNPFVYCLRLPEIRTEFMKQFRKLCCRRSP